MRRLVLNLEDITQKINNGQSAYSISKELGCTKNAILTYLKKNNLKSQHKCKVNYNNLMKDHKDEIITLYNSGMNGNQIAKKLNFSDGHIMALLRKHNVDIRSKNLYTVDETYFEQIDNEEKAYILGWWYSDGNVCDSKLRLCIQQEDEEIVQQIKDCLKTENYNQPDWPEVKKFILQHAQLFLKNNTNLIPLRQHLLYYIKNQPHAKQLRQKLIEVKTLTQLKNILKQK